MCTSIVLNLIVKEYLQDTGSTHGKLDNLKSARKNIRGVKSGEKVEGSTKQKFPPAQHFGADNQETRREKE